MLPRHQAQPRREVSPASETLHWRCESLNGQRAHRSDARMVCKRRAVSV
jgi:hypothetical protein